ncbi:MAG: alkaline phosphatase family protein [Candidatus Hydrogenedentes bacterium]|nr:alkaline phosphatase family protein [Candidatus Hydrogenedentota bacterium]
MSRVLLIGLDGADPELVARWMQAGRLPHLQTVARSGVFSSLNGVTPPVTYPAWTTCVTGVNPGKHGITDFTEKVSGSYAIRFLNSTDRKAPALWNILSDAGKRVCVLGVPGTYPPESVNGIFVSGFDSPVSEAVDRSCVYPKEAWSQVRGWRFAPFQEHRITPDWYKKALHLLEDTIQEKTDIACRLLQEEAWDFSMVVLGEADTASHHFWPLEDEQSPRHTDKNFALDHPIRKIYEQLDSAVGALVDAAGSDTLVLIVSDHGFGGAGVETVHLNNYLAEQGWLRYGAGTGSLLKRMALRWLPTKGRGALFRYFQGMASRAESRARFGGIDWQHTRAWSDELDYFPSVHINLAGREPGGIVAQEAYEDTVQELCDLLERFPAISRALPRNKVYSGAWTKRAPDIIIELAWKNGYRYSCTRARGGASLETLDPTEWCGGKERGNSGVHRNPALLMSNRAIGCDFPSLIDIAPTVLDFLGISLPPMDGVSMIAKKEVPSSSPEGVWQAVPEKPYTTRQEEILEERMRNLGYFE